MKLIKSIAFWAVTGLITAAAILSWLDPEYLRELISSVVEISPIELPAKTFITVLAVSMILMGLIFNKMDGEREPNWLSGIEEKEKPGDTEPLVMEKGEDGMTAVHDQGEIKAVKKANLGWADVTTDSSTANNKPGTGTTTRTRTVTEDNKDFICVQDNKGYFVFRNNQSAVQLLDIKPSELKKLVGNKRAITAYNKKHGTELDKVHLYEQKHSNKNVREIFDFVDDLDAIYLGFGAETVPENIGVKTDTGMIIGFFNWESAGIYFGVQANTVKGWHRKGAIPKRYGMQKFIENFPA